MKLDFNSRLSRELNFSGVMIKEEDDRERRIEFYLKSRDESTWTLLAFSGFSHAMPEKKKLQGPYHSLAQAQASLSAILNVLDRNGFEVAKGTLPIWSLPAQMAVNQQREEVLGELGEYEFDPKDVFFDTLGLDED